MVQCKRTLTPLDPRTTDPGFVRAVLTDPDDAAVVRTIPLAQRMELLGVAEGMETRDGDERVRQLLRDPGCTGCQGSLAISIYSGGRGPGVTRSRRLEVRRIRPAGTPAD